MVASFVMSQTLFFIGRFFALFEGRESLNKTINRLDVEADYLSEDWQIDFSRTKWVANMLNWNWNILPLIFISSTICLKYFEELKYLKFQDCYAGEIFFQSLSEGRKHQSREDGESNNHRRYITGLIICFTLGFSNLLMSTFLQTFVELQTTWVSLWIFTQINMRVLGHLLIWFKI